MLRLSLFLCNLVQATGNWDCGALKLESIYHYFLGKAPEFSLFEIHLNKNRLISICVSDLSIEICRLHSETGDFCKSDMHDNLHIPYCSHLVLYTAVISKENSLLPSHNNSLEEN